MCNSNGGGPALAPWPCAVHKRPILVETGVEVDAIDEVDGFLIIADGGFMPVGFGNRDDAVDTSLLIDFSDGVGDGARSAFSKPWTPSICGSEFVSLIFSFINFIHVSVTRFYFLFTIFYIDKIFNIPFAII